MRKHHDHTRIARAIAAALACLTALAGCAKTAAPVQRTGFAMGSVSSVAVYGAPAAAADAALKAISALDGRISATLPESEIYRLNEAGQASLSPATAEFLQKSAALCAALGGRLDITLGAVTGLWGFAAGTPRLPAREEIAAALKTRGLNELHITDRSAALGEGQKLDPGAVGKGAGCDEALAALRQYGNPAVLSLGGTVLLYGQKDGGPWSVGIRDPYKTADDYFATLTFDPGADGALFISTSGSYEKTFTEGGKTYHHILDPETGYPVENDLVSVTAVSASGLVSDALSTALFAEGLTDAALSWAREYLTGAVFVFADGRVYVTEGLKSAFKLTDAGRFTLIDHVEKAAS